MKQRVIKLKDIDGFTVVSAVKEDTGLMYDILLDSLGKNRVPKCKPRIGVIAGENVICVSVSDRPRILSDEPFYESAEVLRWVSLNKELILKHWNNEISDREILNLLRSL